MYPEPLQTEQETPELAFEKRGRKCITGSAQTGESK